MRNNTAGLHVWNRPLNDVRAMSVVEKQLTTNILAADCGLSVSLGKEANCSLTVIRMWCCSISTSDNIPDSITAAPQDVPTDDDCLRSNFTFKNSHSVIVRASRVSAAFAASAFGASPVGVLSTNNKTHTWTVWRQFSRIQGSAFFRTSIPCRYTTTCIIFPPKPYFSPLAPVIQVSTALYRLYPIPPFLITSSVFLIIFPYQLNLDIPSTTTMFSSYCSSYLITITISYCRSHFNLTQPLPFFHFLLSLFKLTRSSTSLTHDQTSKKVKRKFPPRRKKR